MSSDLSIAVVGATGLVGEALCAQLAARAFPYDRLFLVASDDSAGSQRAVGDSYHTVQTLATFDFSQVQLAFFAVPAAVAREHIPRALAAGCRVIDTSQHDPQDSSGIYLLPEINGELVENASNNLLFFCPDPAARFLSLLVQSLQADIDMQRISAVVVDSVARYGKAAVEELAQQSIALFNMKPVPKNRFPTQVAFNLLPADALADTDNLLTEQSIESQINLLCGRAPGFARVRRLLAPVFHGVGITLQVYNDTTADSAAVLDAVHSSPYLKYFKEDDNASSLSLLTHGTGTDFVYIGNLRMRSPEDPGFDLFVVADPVRNGAALNSVLIGEILVNNGF